MLPPVYGEAERIAAIIIVNDSVDCNIFCIGKFRPAMKRNAAVAGFGVCVSILSNRERATRLVSGLERLNLDVQDGEGCSGWRILDILFSSWVSGFEIARRSIPLERLNLDVQDGEGCLGWRILDILFSSWESGFEVARRSIPLERLNLDVQDGEGCSGWEILDILLFILEILIRNHFQSSQAVTGG